MSTDHGLSGVAYSFTEVRSALQAAGPPGSLLDDLAPSPEALGLRLGLQQAVETLYAPPSDLALIPQTTYSLYRQYRREGTRRGYERVYFGKRERLGWLVLQAAFADESYLDLVCDYLWDVCEETNWVLPAHEPLFLDLFASETGLELAEAIRLLGDRLPAEISQRVRSEIYRRNLAPYRARGAELWWWRGDSNWAGVCHGAVGTTALHLEEDLDTLAWDVTSVLAGLDYFLAHAFAADGTSTEGTSYWQYGLGFTMLFAELLRVRTDGRINLAATDRVRTIARFPVQAALSPECYASFSDCAEHASLYYGVTARLGQHAEVGELQALLPAAERGRLSTHRLCLALRDLLWWDGQPRAPLAPQSCYLPAGALCRLAGQTHDGRPLVLMAKAGHNAEAHNHNDVGSFLLHVDGETLLCDPGGGRYDSEYFGPRRYENLFAASRGHSVPVIAGQFQQAGSTSSSTVLEADTAAGRFSLEMSAAYGIPALTRLCRSLSLEREGGASGAIVLRDEFALTEPTALEEVLVTWLPCVATDNRLLVAGERSSLTITAEGPGDLIWTVTEMTEDCQANEKPRVLKRATLAVPGAEGTTCVTMRLEINPQNLDTPPQPGALA